MRRTLLAHRRDDRSVDCNRRSEHHTFYFILHRGVDDIDAADQVILVVEAPYEVRQSLGRISRKMIDVVESGFEQAFDETDISYRTTHEGCRGGNVLAAVSRQVV